MASQGRINVYMERHRIGPLFEDLMNKILRDMPEEPMVYLLRAMYKKAGMEIPQGIRYGGLRKSTSELNRSSSPERPSRSAMVSSSADVGASRDYERPWATSPTRRTKPKKSEESGVAKHRPEWNADNKVKSSFDELWEETDMVKKEKTAAKISAAKKTGTKQTVANAWASVGLGDDGENYSSPAYHGSRANQRQSRLSEAELLAMESVSPSVRSERHMAPSTVAVSSSGRINNSRKMEAARQREKLAQLLTDVDQRSTDSGYGPDLDQLGADDDAIELLENADDLRREGVKNIPKSGYKLSRNIRYRENEPRVKLNINVNPLSYPESLWQDNADRFDTPDTERSSPEQVKESDDEEEFESVSQVTGPRQPVWKIPGADLPSGASMSLRPSYSTDAPHRSNVQHKKYTERSLRNTTPARYVNRSVDSTEDLSATNKTWTDGEHRVAFEDASPRSSRSIRSESSTGGWLLPDDTEVASAHDWNQRVKGGPPRDPRAY